LLLFTLMAIPSPDKNVSYRSVQYPSSEVWSNGGLRRESADLSLPSDLLLEVS
jgi:hypothetical protein